MTQQWQLQDAKNRFSEVVDKAIHQGPQIVTKRGVETVVIVSIGEYRKLTTPKTSLVDFFRSSPLRDLELDVERDKDSSREVNL